MHKTGEHFPTILIFALLAVSCIAAAPAMAAPQIADFSAEPTSGEAPLTVQFTDESVDNATSWSWSFGDEDTSTDQNPVHTYDTAGTYSVTLNVTVDGELFGVSKVGYITVNEPPLPPTADFFADKTSGDAPLEVQFTDTSYDNPTSWLWSFGDGDTSTEQNPVHTYTTAGIYSVYLTVMNDDGSDDELKSDYINVTSPAVAAAIEYVDCSASRSGLTDPLKLNISQTAAVDNLLLAQINFEGGAVYKPDESWILIDRKDGPSSSVSQALYYKRVQETTPTTYTWTFDGGIALNPDEVGTISEFSGINWTTGPIFGFKNASGNSIYIDLPGILAVPAGSEIVAYYSTAYPRTFPNLPYPGAMTLMCKYMYPGDAELRPSCAAFNESWSTTGNTGTRTINIQSSSYWVGHLVALRSPSVCIQSMNITKTANTTGPVVPGQVVMYNVTVCNKGTEPLTAVKVIDNRTGQHDISGSINPGECKNASWLYTVTDQDARNGTIVNVAYANATACGSTFEIHDNPNATVTLPVKVNSDRIGVYLDGAWYLDMNGDGAWGAGDAAYGFGAPGWTGIVGDWNGDYTIEIGVYRDGAWYLDMNGDGAWGVGDGAYGFGAPGWTGIVGDWDGDGATEIGVYRDGAWYLDMNGDGAWGAGDEAYGFGAPGWYPVIGDWEVLS